MNPATPYRVDVLAGDCGPDRVVLADSYARWLDAASQEHLRACGVPLWRALGQPPGVLVALLAQTQVSFHATVEPDDVLHIHTQVEAWGIDDVVLAHRVMRADTMVCSARETRVLCAYDRAAPGPGLHPWHEAPAAAGPATAATA